jgi:hypothetical protein
MQKRALFCSSTFVEEDVEKDICVVCASEGLSVDVLLCVVLDLVRLDLLLDLAVNVDLGRETPIHVRNHARGAGRKII